MNRTPLRNPWVLLVLAGASALILGTGSRVAFRTPDVGLLAPLLAAPAEILEEVRLTPGQTFGEVLEAASVGWSDQNSLLLAFREQANPRRMRDGTRITFRWLRDPLRLRGVDVNLSKDETVRLLRDEAGWTSGLISTPFRVDTVLVSGVVQDNLWNAMDRNPSLTDLRSQDRALVIDWMDRVFQWQVEFSRQVRTGDTYRLIFEVEIRPDGSVRDGHIVAAEYVNGGTAYRAIWFDPNDDGDGTYYDETGKSVRRSFLMKPLQFRRISSVFSSARPHPILNVVRAHRGVDYAADTGTPVMATGDGVVIYAAWKGDLGNLVEIRHPNGWVTRYGHLSSFAPGIRAGTRVKQSQTIGRVGMTGLANGPHLHYEMRRSDGTALNPLRVILPPGDPVPSDAWGKWALESRQRLILLEELPGPPIAVLAESPEPATASGGEAAGGV